jgi:hypothetical protein
MRSASVQADDLAKLLHARRCGQGRWRAQCPVHGSRGLTLALYAGKDRTHLTCFVGCHSDDVLATLGLTWKDTLYDDKRLTPEEKKVWARKKYIAELYAHEQRMQELKMMLRIVEKKAVQG